MFNISDKVRREREYKRWFYSERFELVKTIKPIRKKYYIVGLKCYLTLESAKKASGGVELVAIHSPSVPQVTYTRIEV